MSNLCRCNELAGPPALHSGCFGQAWLFEGASPETWQAVSNNLVRKRLAVGDEAHATISFYGVLHDGSALTMAFHASGITSA